VVLDEPFSGLDPVNSRVMKDVVVDIARSGRTVLFSTHIMDQAERMCDRIVIMARGRTVVDGAVADIKREVGNRHVQLTFTRDRDKARRVLDDRTLVAHMDDNGASAELELAEGATGDRLLEALVRSGAGLSQFAVVEPSLESIFISKVGAASAAPSETPHA
jgi:ABC-2 type transport system ATP-binding protein